MPQTPSRPRYALRLFQRRLRLEPGRSYVLGREEDADFRLGHRSVLPRHCTIRADEDGVRFEALEAGASLRLGGREVQQGSWTSGVVLEVGDIPLDLETLIYLPTAIPQLNQQPRQDEFADQVWQELRRAPWLLISAAIHALLFFLLWLGLDHEIPRGPDEHSIHFENHESGESLTLDDDTSETLEEVEMDEAEPVENELQEQQDDDAIERELMASEAVIEPESLHRGLLTQISQGRNLGDILKEGGSNISRAFRDGVRRSRRDGLEIVFVFDSTGSMSQVLQAAKDRIGRMLEVLQELVPFARVGVITYRDHGFAEDYLTRQVRLSRDFYRAINFMQGVYAGGGGDEPEAVQEALQLAIAEQKWSPSARKLVILIGDAPPHTETMAEIRKLALRFKRSKRGQIHAIITPPDSSEAIAKLTARSFKQIARAGGGEALAFADEELILQHVMKLAFGKGESRSLSEVYRLAEGRSRRSSVHGRMLASGKSIRQLDRAFRTRVVEHDVVKAVLLQPRKSVLLHLISCLEDRRYPAAGRHAASYILQRCLNLGTSPINPVKVDSLSPGRARSLREMVERNFPN